MVEKSLMKPHYQKKKTFYFNMEVITDANYAHAERIWKDFERNNLGKHYDLYVQSDTLLLVMYLKTFKMCVLK